jgi:hypothetical protein
MVPRNRYIVEEYVALRMATDRGVTFVKDKCQTRSRALLDDKGISFKSTNV